MHCLMYGIEYRVQSIGCKVEGGECRVNSIGGRV